MLALTERHPWGHAIAHWGKDCENRTWLPPPDLLGERFAIHAGKLTAPKDGKVTGAAADYWDEIVEALDWMRAEGLIPDDLVVTPRQLVEASSAVACTVRLAGVIGPRGYLRARGEADTQLCVEARSSRWYTGEVGFVLADKIARPKPVACRGAQKFWVLPPDVERQVLEQEQLALAKKGTG